MKIFKKEIQKQNTSKFLYDIAKVIFATVVVMQLIKPQDFRISTFLNGIVSMAIFFVIAFKLDGKEVDD